MRKLLFKIWPILLLVVLVSVVWRRNVVPGTYLTGWDNLHPEFDFVTNVVDRSLKGIWQYYQGTGVPSGNAHVAELPRQLVMWIASLIVPNNLLRYGYHLFAWFAGGVGIYVLLHQLLIDRKLRGVARQGMALVGAGFYLLNLGTLQNFYAPYEAFSHFFMMLPWLLLVTWSYLQKGSKRRLWQLLAVNVMAVSMAYIPTIFIVYMLVMVVIYLGELVRSKSKSWRRVLASLGVILVVNAFWLMPFGHFVLTGTGGVVESKINRMFTKEAFLRNQEYGSMEHSFLLEGFWFDTTDLKSVEGEHDYMMRPWMDYLEKSYVREIMWVMFGLIVIGGLWGLISGKQYAGELAILGLIGLFMLINDNLPTGELFRLLQDKLPLFEQVLRFPFTKFVVVIALVYSVFIVMAVEMVMRLSRRIGYVLAGLILGMILLVQRPVFEGNLFYDKLRVEIPQEYFELFEFFQHEDRYRGRVANLPQPTFWGWTSYGWGYRGSGFPWYGIPQPILDRNFDVWSPESEEYYREISSAIYDNNEQEYFLSVLDKYGVDYVWIDGWVINPHKPKMLVMDEMEVWLSGGGYSRVYEVGKQVVYKRDKAVIQEGVEKMGGTDKWRGYPVVELGHNYAEDHDYLRYGDRIYTKQDLPTMVVDREDGKKVYGYEASSMRQISMGTIEVGQEYKLLDEIPDVSYDPRTWWMREMYVEYDSEAGEDISVCLKKIGQASCYYIGVDTNEDGGYRWGRFEMVETTVPSQILVKVEGGVNVRDIRFGVFDMPDGETEFSSQDVGLSENNLIIDVTNVLTKANNCYEFGDGWYERVVMNEDGQEFTRYSAYDASSCESVYVGDSEILVSGGKLRLLSRNIEGRPVKFCLRHDPPGSCLVEDIVGVGDGWYWSEYEIPPVTRVGELYLEFDNYAVGSEIRTNDVARAEIELIEDPGVGMKNDERDGLIFVNNQAYREGWVATEWPMANGKWQMFEHVKVNGWKNGWVVDECTPRANGQCQIVVMYWPQLLEYLGFLILAGGLIWVGLARRDRISL